MTTLRIGRRRFLVGATLLAASGLPRAAAYPTGTIRILYNFAAGGPGDAALRYLADQLAPRLGQQVIVENRTGGSGSIGILGAARSAPDGYTLLFTTLPGVIQLPYFADKTFDPVKSLQPLALIGSSPLVILAHPSVPAERLSGLRRMGQGAAVVDPVRGRRADHRAGDRAARARDRPEARIHPLPRLRAGGAGGRGRRGQVLLHAAVGDDDRVRQARQAQGDRHDERRAVAAGAGRTADREDRPRLRAGGRLLPVGAGRCAARSPGDARAGLEGGARAAGDRREAALVRHRAAQWRARRT